MRATSTVVVLCVALFTTSLLAVPTTSEAETRRESPLTPTAARLRMHSIIEASSTEPTKGHIEALRNIAERCEDPEICAAALFNAGTLAASLDEPDLALELLRSSDRMATNPGMRANARFNLAHVLYETGLADSESDEPPSMEEQIERILIAAAAFRAAHDADPSRVDAIKNMERLRRLARSLQKTQEELEEQRQRREEAANQLEQLADEQDRQANQSQRQADMGAPPQQQAQQQQQDLSEQTEQAESKMSDQLEDQDQAATAIEEAREAQQRAESSLESGNTEQAAREQREAADQLRSAAQQLRESTESGPSDSGQGEEADQPGESPGQPERESEQPGIDPVAEYLLEKEREERQRRARYIRRSNKRQVERDW